MDRDLDSLLADLEALDEDARERAVQGLVDLGDPAAFSALERVAASDGSIQVRFLAKKALHKLQENIADAGPDVELAFDVESLADALARPDAAARRKVLEMAVSRKHKVIVPLLPPLLERETDPSVRRAALLALALSGRKAVPTLARFLDDPDARVRAGALEGLGIVDEMDVFPFAVKALSDSELSIQKSALRLCRRLGKTNLFRLIDRMARSHTLWKRRSAAAACALLRRPELGPVMDVLQSDGDEAVQTAVKKARKGMAARQTLPSPSKNSTPEGTRRPSSEESGEAPPSSGQEGAADERPLSGGVPSPHALDELQEWVREEERERVPEMVSWLEAEEDPRVIASLVAALGLLGDEETVGVLRPYLEVQEDRVRANAAEAIGRLGRPDLLAPLLWDTDGRTRANVLVALRTMPWVKLHPPLKDLATQEDARSKKCAIYAIVELARPEARPLLKTLAADIDEDVHEKARQAMAILDSSAAGGDASGSSDPGVKGSGKGPAGETLKGVVDGLASKLKRLFDKS